MTIHEVTSQLWKLSVKGQFNGEKFTFSQFEKLVSNYFRKGTHLKLGNRVVMEIMLPDGSWFFQIVRYNDRPDGFDYIIPDTRDQEKRLLDELCTTH